MIISIAIANKALKTPTIGVDTCTAVFCELDGMIMLLYVGQQFTPATLTLLNWVTPSSGVSNVF